MGDDPVRFSMPPLPVPAAPAVVVGSRRRVWIGIGCAAIAIGVVISLAAPAMFRWVARSGAADLAVGVGLQLQDGDDVEYGKVYSSFLDSSSYLVVKVRSSERRDELLRSSQLSDVTPAGATYFLFDLDHGPPRTPGILTAQHEVPARGVLYAAWDPERDSGTRIYIYAGQS